MYLFTLQTLQEGKRNKSRIDQRTKKEKEKLGNKINLN
jgi:hypothetical protein